MKLSEELVARGLIANSTLSDLPDLDKIDPLVVYVGLDASAPSQTIGNLIPLMTAKTFLRHGHKAIVLAGGATSLIGDPGGRDSERKLADKEFIGNNTANAKKQIEIIMRSIDSSQWTLVNNLDWWSDIGVLDFLRDVGKHYSVGQLIKRDYVAQRLGQDKRGISYAEFSYSLLQGYDFLYLFEKYGCNFQIGGSDQWGNCLSGVDLIHKKTGQTVNALTIPLLINKSTGRKFGKSEGGAVWLSPDMTSPFDFYQFWFNSSDEDVGDYLLVFSEISPSEIKDIVSRHRKDPSRRLAQIKLAELLTNLVHGETALEVVEAINSLVFSKPDAGERLSKLSVDKLGSQLETARLKPDGDILSILIDDLKLATSRRQAREFIGDGGISLINKKGTFKLKDQVVDKALIQDSFQFEGQAFVFISRGRNKVGLVKV